MRSNKSLCRLCVADHRNVECRGIEERPLFHTRRPGDCVRTFEYLWIKIAREERFPRNPVFNVSISARLQQRLLRWDAPAIGIAVIEFFEVKRVLQHGSVARRDLVDVSGSVA